MDSVWDLLPILAFVALIYLYRKYRHDPRFDPDVPLRGSASRPPSGTGSSPANIIDSIPAHADMHVKLMERHSGVRLDYDEASFAQLDDMIEEGWGGEAPAMLDTTALAFGSFMGESIRHLLGGEWSYDEETGCHLTQVGGVRMTLFPFDKVKKRFLNGDEDSLASYYAKIKQVVEQERSRTG